MNVLRNLARAWFLPLILAYPATDACAAQDETGYFCECGFGNDLSNKVEDLNYIAKAMERDPRVHMDRQDPEKNAIGRIVSKIDNGHESIGTGFLIKIPGRSDSDLVMTKIGRASPGDLQIQFKVGATGSHAQPFAHTVYVKSIVATGRDKDETDRHHIPVEHDWVVLRLDKPINDPKIEPL